MKKQPKFKNLPKWQKKLSASQRQHLWEDSGGPILVALKRNRAFHKEQRELGNGELCFECRSIAVALGLE